MRTRIIAGGLLLGLLGSPGRASATCVLLPDGTAVCSTPDGHSFHYRVEEEPPPAVEQEPIDWEQVRSTRRGRFHLEAVATPVASVPLEQRGRAVILGADLGARLLYAWGPAGGGFVEQLLAALGAIFVGNELGLRIGGGLGAARRPDGWAPAGHFHFGIANRTSFGRFWVPAMFAVFPAVGFSKTAGERAQLELVTDLPFGMMLTRHLAIELRLALVARLRGDDPRLDFAPSLSLVLL